MQPAQLVEHTMTKPEHERTIHRSTSSKHPLDWSADGRFILYRLTGSTRNADIWVVPLDG